MEKIKVTDLTGIQFLTEEEFADWVDALSNGQKPIIERSPNWFLKVDVLNDASFIITEVKGQRERVLAEKATRKVLKRLVFLMLCNEDLKQIENEELEWSDFFEKYPWSFLSWFAIAAIIGTAAYAVIYGFYDLFFG